MIDPTALATYNTAVPILSGCFTFGSALALSTLAQKAVGISTATKLLPSVVGMVTVCLASLASQQAAIVSHELVRNPSLEVLRNRKNVLAATSAYYKDYLQIGDYVKVPMHSIRVCAVGLLTFKLLGGRFWAIAPSSITNLGSFARWSIPCSERYATKSERALLEKMGRKWGCHTCGSRMLGSKNSFRFVGDHMPPKSVAEAMNSTWWRRAGLWRKVKYRFYPQCANCSNSQGTILSKKSIQLSGRQLPAFVRASSLQNAGAGQMAHFHGLRPRINHLTGCVVAGITVAMASDRQIAMGNPMRFQELHHRLVDAMKASGLTRLYNRWR